MTGLLVGTFIGRRAHTLLWLPGLQMRRELKRRGGRGAQRERRAAGGRSRRKGRPRDGATATEERS